jgi:hypothetical protein
MPEQLKQEYAAELISQWSTFPPVLLQPVDLKAAIASSPYRKQANVEGYWENNYVNDEVFSFAEKLKSGAPNPGSWNPNKLQALRDKITTENIMKNKESVSEAHRYPIPEVKPWPNQDKFLACFEALEAIAMNPESKSYRIRFVNTHFPRLSLDDLLHLNVVNYYMDHGVTHSSSRLPLSGDSKETAGSGQFSICFPDPDHGGTINLEWTQGLCMYIREYNILPSAEFLIKVDKFLRVCHTHYLTQANNLERDAAPSAAPRR